MPSIKLNSQDTIGEKNKGISRSPIKVTLLSGFLGSGKTTLLKHILENRDGLKVAVIVNDMAELNIDAHLIKQTSITQTKEEVVEMQNGCICCTLREDLLVEIKRLAIENRYDYVIIESTGISEPMQVAETFTFTDDNEKVLMDYAQLDTCVTVVDAVNFFNNIQTIEKLQDRGEVSGEDDERTIANLMVDQVEFANVILINKIDLVDQIHIDKVKQAVNLLNPSAQLYLTKNSMLPLKKIMNTGLFSMEAAVSAPGWMTVLRGSKIVPESEEYGITSFVYRARRPFHPERLDKLLEKDKVLPGVIRSKGFSWLAPFPTVQLAWQSAGELYDMEPEGPWICEMNEEERDNLDAKYLEKAQVDMVDGSDKRQEIVFIGFHLDQDQIYSLLDPCLLTEEEMALGEESWPETFKLENDAWNLQAYFMESEGEEENDEENDEE